MRNAPFFMLALLAHTSLTQAAFALDVNALPTGGQVASGSAGVSQSGAHMNIQQHSDKAIINWQSFDVGRNAHVQFHQNSGNSVALNRVIAGDASQIHGRISANGQVYLINPSGVVFGNSARVDVGGLVASTHDMADGDFLSGKRVFRRNGATGKIVNNGEITAANGGDVVLIGTEVGNQGRITANGGNIMLAAGEQVVLSAGANGYLQVAVDGATLDMLVANGGVLQADGGQIVMTSEAASAAFSSVVANTGTLRAQSLQNKGGQILLLADMENGETQVAGILDASAPVTGDGGFIETSAATVNVANGTKVTTRAASGKTGEWLIDPDDFTIAASGGNIAGATLSANLENTNQTLETNQAGSGGNGDLFVNDAVSWGANTTLTLRADRNIHINDDITATGNTAGLTLAYGRTTGGSDYYIDNGASVTLSGAAPVLNIGEFGSLQAYTVINNVTQLQAMATGNRYALGSDIDASATSGWNGGQGYAPMSLGGGKFHGLGHTIDNLYINRASGSVGLFGSSSATGLIRDVGLTNVDFTGTSLVGGFVGGTYNGVTMHDVFVTGTIEGDSFGVGGLIGRQWGTANIWNAYTNVDVTGVVGVGGLIGDSDGTTTMNNVFTAGNVTAEHFAGGLVGQAINVSVSDAYSTGDITAISQYAGGIFGISDSSSITNAYVAGAVTGPDARAITAGSAPGTTASQVYWNTDVTSLAAGSAGVSAGSTGRTTAEMMDMASFAGWDIGDEGGQDTVWRIYEGQSAPLLRQFLTPLTITANDDAADSGTAYSGGNGASYSTAPDSTLLGAATYGGSAQGASAAGSYAISVDGFYSTQLGYDISYADGQLVLTNPPAPPPQNTNKNLPRDNSSTLSLTTGAITSAVATASQPDSGSTDEIKAVHAPGQNTRLARGMDSLLTVEDNYIDLPE